jgi:hypothetical protein
MTHYYLNEGYDIMSHVTFKTIYTHFLFFFFFSILFSNYFLLIYFMYYCIFDSFILLDILDYISFNDSLNLPSFSCQNNIFERMHCILMKFSTPIVLRYTGFSEVYELVFYVIDIFITII